MRFGDKVRTLRLQKNLTQVELANKLGQTPSTVQSYENHRSHPKTVAGYRKLAAILDTGVHYLMTDDDEQPCAEPNGQSLREARGAIKRVTSLVESGRLTAEDRQILAEEIEALKILMKK